MWASLRRVNDLDLWLCLRCNRASRQPGTRAFFRLISRLGDGIFWYVVMLLLLLIYGVRALPAVLEMLFAGVVGAVVYKWLKSKTLRPRPCHAYPDIMAAAAPLDQFSFPSGHTLHATSLSLIACAHFHELAVLLYPFAALVALSRPILGLHYPSDVLAGAAIGAAIAGLLAPL